MNTAWYLKAGPTLETTPHVHDSDELIGFFGSDPEDPDDLNGEVSIWLEDEKHIITRSTIIFVPAGLVHCPLVLNRVDRPIFHFTTVNIGQYNVLKRPRRRSSTPAARVGRLLPGRGQEHQDQAVLVGDRAAEVGLEHALVVHEDVEPLVQPAVRCRTSGARRPGSGGRGRPGIRPRWRPPPGVRRGRRSMRCSSAWKILTLTLTGAVYLRLAVFDCAEPVPTRRSPAGRASGEGGARAGGLRAGQDGPLDQRPRYLDLVAVAEEREGAFHRRRRQPARRSPRSSVLPTRYSLGRGHPHGQRRRPS